MWTTTQAVHEVLPRIPEYTFFSDFPDFYQWMFRVPQRFLDKWQKVAESVKLKLSQCGCTVVGS